MEVTVPKNKKKKKQHKILDGEERVRGLYVNQPHDPRQNNGKTRAKRAKQQQQLLLAHL